MKPVERDELWEIMDYLICELDLGCYLKFGTQNKGQNRYEPQLRVVFKQYYDLNMGIPLGEIVECVQKYGVKDTCANIERALMIVLARIRRDHPGLFDK